MSRLLYRALHAAHEAVHTVLWVYKPVDHTRLYPVAGEGRMPRFSILPTEKVWLAWCRVWVHCAYARRGSVAGVIFGHYAKRVAYELELKARRDLRRAEKFPFTARREARRQYHEGQAARREALDRIRTERYMDDNYASW